MATSFHPDKLTSVLLSKGIKGLYSSTIGLLRLFTSATWIASVGSFPLPPPMKDTLLPDEVKAGVPLAPQGSNVFLTNLAIVFGPAFLNVASSRLAERLSYVRLRIGRVKKVIPCYHGYRVPKVDLYGDS